MPAYALTAPTAHINYVPPTAATPMALLTVPQTQITVNAAEASPGIIGATITDLAPPLTDIVATNVSLAFSFPLPGAATFANGTVLSSGISIVVSNISLIARVFFERMYNVGLCKSAVGPSGRVMGQPVYRAHAQLILRYDSTLTHMTVKAASGTWTTGNSTTDATLQHVTEGTAGPILFLQGANGVCAEPPLGTNYSWMSISHVDQTLQLTPPLSPPPKGEKRPTSSDDELT